MCVCVCVCVCVYEWVNVASAADNLSCQKRCYKNTGSPYLFRFQNDVNNFFTEFWKNPLLVCCWYFSGLCFHWKFVLFHRIRNLRSLSSFAFDPLASRITILCSNAVFFSEHTSRWGCRFIVLLQAKHSFSAQSFQSRHVSSLSFYSWGWKQSFWIKQIVFDKIGIFHLPSYLELCLTHLFFHLKSGTLKSIPYASCVGDSWRWIWDCYLRRLSAIFTLCMFCKKSPTFIQRACIEE